MTYQVGLVRLGTLWTHIDFSDIEDLAGADETPAWDTPPWSPKEKVCPNARQHRDRLTIRKEGTYNWAAPPPDPHSNMHRRPLERRILSAPRLKPSPLRSGSTLFVTLDTCAVSFSPNHEPVVSVTARRPETNGFSVVGWWIWCLPMSFASRGLVDHR